MIPLLCKEELRGFPAAHFNIHSPNPLYECAWEGEIILTFSACLQQELLTAFAESAVAKEQITFAQSAVAREQIAFWAFTKDI